MAKHGVTEFLEVFESDKSIFFDLETDLLLTLDDGGNIIDVNPAFEKILGYTERDVIGQSLIILISMKDLDATKQFHFLKRGGGEVLYRVEAWRNRNHWHYAIFRRVA